jgi:hypothetical protein
MLEFKKIPIWKPGKYNRIIEETVASDGFKLNLDKVKMKQRLQELGEYSLYGLAYDLNNVHDMICGSEKTIVMKELDG